jgi:hypothetical protein
MDTNRMRRYGRSTVFALLIILALCVTAAGAATLEVNPALKVTKTFAIATTTAPALAACPDGYVCLTDAEATTQFGTYSRYSDAICGYGQNTATLAAVAQVPKYCVKRSENQYPALCPEGCTCMAEPAAKEKFGVYTRCGTTPCYTVVTGSAQVNAYCFRQGITPTTPVVTCPEGCNCISEVTAKEKGGSWLRCSADICGYEQSSAAGVVVVNMPKYCMKQQETTPVCPSGCSCLSEADAKLKGLTTKCNPNEEPCGYQNIAATANTQGYRIALYCYNTGITVTPTPQTCPDGCYCISETDAKAKFGSFNYTRCSETVCGYDQAVTSTYAEPRYCFRPRVTVTPTPSVCPQGCLCLTDAAAKDKGLAACGGVRTFCGYNENKQSEYCFGQPPSTTCVYDYQKETCTGTCPLTGEACQLNTVNHDPTTGKVTYAECHCKGACVLDANNRCSGTCPDGGQCTSTVTKDDSGKEKTSCACSLSGTESPTPVPTQQPGFFDSIGSFFSRLFGRK